MASSSCAVLIFLLTTFVSFYIVPSSTSILPGLPNPLATFFDSATTSSTTTSTRQPYFDQGKRYIYYAGAAYCPLASNWTCEYCKMTQIPNPTPDAPHSQGVILIAEHTNGINGSRALVIKDDVNQEIVVAWRESNNIQNFVTDYLDNNFAYPYNNTIGVHSGCWGTFQSLYADVTSTLVSVMRSNPNYSFVFTGHGLGGLLAMYHAFALTQDHYIDDRRVSLFSYGAPRGGNKAFADWYNDRDFVVGRYTANKDIFPHILPSRTGYVQINTEIWIQGTGPSATTTFCNRNVYEDLNCSARNSPLYNPLDHTKYYDVDITTCFATGFVQSLADITTLLNTIPANLGK